jgi:hypothetical protein
MAFHKDGWKYSGRGCSQSLLIEYVRNLPEETVIYANDPDNVYYLTQRQTRNVPRCLNITTSSPNVAYESELSQMEKTLRETNGIIVYFAVESRYYPKWRELQDRLDLVVRKRFSDGVISMLSDDVGPSR